MRTGYLTRRWYARRNDLVGGWCVMPVDEPPSQGVPEVADFTTHELAEHIAELHNVWLALQEARLTDEIDKRAR